MTRHDNLSGFVGGDFIELTNNVAQVVRRQVVFRFLDGKNREEWKFLSDFRLIACFLGCLPNLVLNGKQAERQREGEK